MIIRELSTNELPATLRRMEKVFKESQGGSSMLAGLPAPGVAGTLLAENGFRFFSAFENGREIGTVGLKNSHIVVLTVDAGKRKKGTGSALVQAVVSQCAGPVSVNAEQPAVPFYTKLGFVAADRQNPTRTTPEGERYVPMYRRNAHE